MAASWLAIGPRKKEISTSTTLKENGQSQEISSLAQGFELKVVGTRVFNPHTVPDF